MSKRRMETDYLIIGGGAMGAAFADEIFTHDVKATLTIVDKRQTLGGHWNNAYPFVGLHQPAAFYGVNSLELSNGSKDLSSKGEILAYYQKVLDKFLASGRVTFLGGHHYIGNKQVTPLDAPDEIMAFKVNRRVVNATYMGVEVPSTHPPKFEIEDGVPFVPLNDLVDQYDKWERFYVLGNGKTGMDAILYLLSQQVAPEKIHWIMPNDAWCLIRAKLQVREATAEVLRHCKASIKANDATELFTSLEKIGSIVRIDESITPTKWRCATVSLEEVDQLRRITNTIRKGRVQRLTSTGIEFQSETVAYPANSLFVNCTADGLVKKPSTPFFSEGRIDLQPVVFCQQVFSAAAIGRLELTRLSDARRNQVVPVLHPEFPPDWPVALAASVDNLLKLNMFFPLWMAKARLNMMAHEPFHKYLGYSVQAALLAPKLRAAAARIAA